MHSIMTIAFLAIIPLSVLIIGRDAFRFREDIKTSIHKRTPARRRGRYDD